MIIAEVMAPQVPDINYITRDGCGSSGSEFSSLALRDTPLQTYFSFPLFRFYFSIYSYFHVIFVSHSQFIRYILKKQRNFVVYV